MKLSDTRYAIRVLRRPPLFTSAVVLTLALAIAAIGIYAVLAYSGEPTHP